MRTFISLLTLALLAIAPVSAANCAVQPRTETQPGLERTEGVRLSAAPVSFTGTWETIAGDTDHYTVTLKQIGKNVTGSFSPGNGKIFAGVVSGNKLTFKWTKDEGFEGIAEFIMDEDGKGFTGSSTVVKPQELTVTWNSYKPEATSFAGTWETISDGQNSIPLTIVQTGSKVTGLYPSGNGKIEGTVTGRVLLFKWESDGGSGSGRFVIDESNQAFSGTYNFKDANPDDGEKTWTGKRVVSGSGGKGLPVSFAGEWNVAWNGKSVSMFIGHADNQANGYYIIGPENSYTFLNPTLVGNTLRFKLNSGDVGQFVMDEGGKSFKGSIDGNAVTGTFVAPLPDPN